VVRAGESSDGLADYDFYSDVDASVVVQGVDASLLAGTPGGEIHDSHFEESYRSAFVNYEEGKRFRVKDQRARSLASTVSAPQTALSISPFTAAATPVYRVITKTNGIYRLTWSYLLDPTTGVAPGLAGAAPSSFKVMNNGVEVPIRVVDGGNGTFDPGDYIEFYGEGKLGEQKVVLNYHFDPNIYPGFQDINQANDFTDENVYFLFGEPGTRSRIPNLSGTVQGAFPTSTSFSETAHRELDNRFVPDGLNDPFYQGPSLVSNNGSFNPDPNSPNCGYNNLGINTSQARNWLGPVPSSDPNHYCEACSLNLADPVNSAATATLRVRMRGSTSEAAPNPDHMTVVQLGSVAAQSSTLCWDNESLVTQTLNVPQSALVGGAGVFIELPGLSTTVSFEAFYLDWIEVDYPAARIASVHWTVCFFVISIATALVFRRRFRVSF